VLQPCRRGVRFNEGSVSNHERNSNGRGEEFLQNTARTGGSLRHSASCGRRYLYPLNFDTQTSRKFFCGPNGKGTAALHRHVQHSPPSSNDQEFTVTELSVPAYCQLGLIQVRSVSLGEGFLVSLHRFSDSAKVRDGKIVSFRSCKTRWSARSFRHEGEWTSRRIPTDPPLDRRQAT